MIRIDVIHALCLPGDFMVRLIAGRELANGLRIEKSPLW
ncbi:hypothetical protein MMEU_1854 [Mycobacterium marinum str. Europe]|nr:hypothetical protein MMEU_1854 [Mycobacterium marinum str. Europe]